MKIGKDSIVVKQTATNNKSFVVILIENTVYLRLNLFEGVVCPYTYVLYFVFNRA